MKVIDVVNGFYAITNEGRAEDLPSIVAEDVTFVGPLMRADGAEAYVAMNQQLLGFHQETRMLQQFGDGDHACSIYELDMSTPAGGTLTLTMADWIRVRDGKIAEQRIYFDPRAFAEAFGM